MEVREVLLPGIGLCYEFNTADRDRIGVIAKRSGDFEVVRYQRSDPDAAVPIMRLTGEEAEAMAQILGAPRIVDRFSALTSGMAELDASQVRIRPGTPFVDRPLGDTQVRTRTGASIVAIVRDELVLPSPGPSDVAASGGRSRRDRDRRRPDPRSSRSSTAASRPCMPPPPCSWSWY